MRLLLAILLAVLPVTLRAATTYSPTNLLRADIDWAISQAGDGDTILLPSGTLSITTSIKITNAIQFLGQGINSTILEDDVASNSDSQSKGAVICFTSTTSGKAYRLGHMWIRDGTATSRATDFTAGGVRVLGTSKAFMMDHVKIDSLENALFMTQAGALLGVATDCVLIQDRTQGFRFYHDQWGGHSWGDGAWTNSVAYGTTNAGFYVENCYITNKNGSQPVTDSFGGAMWVFRFNTVSNNYLDMHGTGSTGRYRGTRGGEIYGNLIYDVGQAEGIDSRSGTWLVFSNNVTANKFMTLHDYRWEGPLNIWYGVDGYTPWDNIASATVIETGTSTGNDPGYPAGGNPPPVPRTLTNSLASWTTDEHRGRIIRNTTTARTNVNDFAYWATSPLQQCAVILSNTATVIYFSLASQYNSGGRSFDCEFLTGDTYEIVGGVTESIDMSGLGAGDLLSGTEPDPVWLNQTVDPSYAWANSLNGGAAGTGTMTPDLPNIIEGLHFTNNVAKSGYTPLQYPHPLVAYFSGGGVAVALSMTGNGATITDGSSSPDLGNHTDFGNVDTNLATLVRTYTIYNGGTNSATIGTVTVSGSEAADFTVTDQPDASIAAGGSTTFQVTFAPSAIGLRSAALSFSNDDPTYNPFNFSIQGTGVDGSAPEIVVEGNGTSIADGDGTPSTTDDTDFGNVSYSYWDGEAVVGSTRTVTYTIENVGNSTLNVGTVTLSGTHASDYSVVTQPSSTVAASSTTTFSIQFAPSAAGVRSAALSFTNSDTSEDPFNFSIQGTGVTPNIGLIGNLVAISNGDITPSTADHTDFGSVQYGTSTQSMTYTITNTGTQTVELGDLSILGSSKFTITSSPAITVAAAGSTTFTVLFTPTAYGTEQATVNVPSNDPDAPYYTFLIQGLGNGGSTGLLNQRPSQRRAR